MWAVQERVYHGRKFDEAGDRAGGVAHWDALPQHFVDYSIGEYIGLGL